jgi:thioredoxin reductase (NADPH)
MEQDTKTHDVIIIGAGPSALAAAVYTTREDIDTVLVEKALPGGLAAITDWVDNYPGFSKGISGMDLATELQAQAERFGADIRMGEVTGIESNGDEKIIKTIDGDLRAKAVLIATGSDYKKLGIAGEAEFYGRGVHYCATCDGAFYRDKKLAVVGGGNSAVQEALFLTRFASHIDLLVRSSMKASEVLQRELDKAVKEGKVTVHLEVTPEEIIANDAGEVYLVKGKKSGEEFAVEIDGVFVSQFKVPNNCLVF